jgi:branched-subunit amino acid aminotransferase/4-amino-4-deoxychorismate lyase
VKDKDLLTPTHGVLEGIIRETVFEIAGELGYKALAANISRYDLYQADEIFLCSTADGIIPASPGPSPKRSGKRILECCKKAGMGPPFRLEEVTGLASGSSCA